MSLRFPYCDSLDGAWLAEPLSVASSTAFLGVAWWSWRRFRYLPRNTLLTLGLLFVGIGSAAWHSTHTEFGKWLDIGSVATFITLYFGLVLYDILGWRVGRALGATMLYLTAGWSLGYLLAPWLTMHSGGLVLPFLTLIAIGFLVSDPKRRHDAWLAAGWLSIGVVFRQFNLPLCGTFTTGLHFAWHLCAAMSIAYALRLRMKIC